MSPIKIIRIAALDDTNEWLDFLKSIYSTRANIQIDTFKYPEQYDDFLKASEQADVKLVDHRLGGTNGANVARNLFRSGTKGINIVMSADDFFNTEYSTFYIYVRKEDIAKDPDLIFHIGGNKYDHVIEMNTLAVMEV